MKKRRWVLATLLLAAIPMFAWMNVARAQHFATTVEDDQTIHSSLYSTGRDISIKGTVHGDIFCAGQKVTISATVYGDVVCAGMDVTISGKVEGDVRLAGQRVIVSGEIVRNATVVAGNFSFDADAKIGGDLTTNGGELNSKGSVGRDIVAGGNKLIINGTVGRNVKSTTAEVQLKDEARVGGGLYYSSTREASIAQGAVVKGKTDHQQAEQKQGDGFNVVFYLYALVSLTLIGTILAMLFPRFFKKTNEYIEASIPKTMVVGLLGGIMGIALTIGLLLSLVGIPLALSLLLALLGGAVLSGPITAYYVGSLVLRRVKAVNPALIAMAGGPILITLYYLPFIGLVMLLAAYGVGFGALLQAIRPYVGLAPAKTSKKR